jgi:LPS O-antigen subunit length determinant protein (WzzB/FepE family)
MQTTTKDIFYFTSINLQRKIFFENDYLTALNPKNEPIDDVEGYFLSFINSISIQAPVTKQTKDETVGNLLEKPYSVSLKGRNDKIISSFLNELAASANSETVDDLINIIKQKIGIRLDEISKEHGLLLTGAQRDRLSQIERIKEEDGQKIREINDQIDALRYKAQQVRLNQITILSKAAKLAGSLGIIENNLKQISESESNFNLNIAINDDEDDLPEWYLYGEKALLERVELLESRTSDDPFIPELVTLTNQLKAVQNNNVLKTLQERQDDSPFSARINELDIERINLESSDPSPSGIDSMQLTQSAYSEKIPNKNILIIAVALIGSFMFSIFLALLTNLFKEDETESTTK